MARNLTGGMVTEITGAKLSPIYFVEIDFDGGTIYLWSGFGTVSWNAHSWVGVGNLGSIATVVESNDVIAQNIILSLSGIAPQFVGLALDDCRQNSTVRVWFGALADDGAIIANPAQIFLGHLDVPTITEGANASTISITCENPLIDLNRASNRRYTPEDQKIDYPTDKGFDFVASIQDWSGEWGKPSKTSQSGMPPTPRNPKVHR